MMIYVCYLNMPQTALIFWAFVNVLLDKNPQQEPNIRNKLDDMMWEQVQKA